MPKLKQPPKPSSKPKGVKSLEVLAFMRQFHAKRDRLPSARKVCDHFGFRSLTAAFHHIRKLKKQGLLEKDGHIYYRFPRP